ncbi:MAG: hypothetical protein PHU25_14955 [Deltaproteobacteria bacterium]|nr:hypothetical protein [Deltaproteobacteria bacterium]
MLGLVMSTGPADTARSAEAFIVEGYRRMSAAEKLRRVADLNEAILGLAAARIRSQYGPNIEERELRLRLASLWLDRETMMRVFGWDPEEKGY